MRKSRLAAAVAGAASSADRDGPSDRRHRRHYRHDRQIPKRRRVAVELDGEWFDFCTGTLVAPNVVLTAAHCTAFFTVMSATRTRSGRTTGGLVRGRPGR